MLKRILVCAVLSSALLACGSEQKTKYPTTANPPATPPPITGANSADFDAKVAPVFKKICTRCHTPESGLPTAFLTSEKAAKGQALAEIKSGAMPKGAPNQAEFAPNKAIIIEILSRN